MNQAPITDKDPILAALARIEAKQDESLENQARMDEEIRQIHRECKRSAVITGGLSGGIVAAGIELLRIKFGA